MIKTIALTAVLLSTATVATTDLDLSPLTQYGGLGLSATVVAFLCKYLNDRTKANEESRKTTAAEHRAERAELVTMLQKKEEENNNLVKQSTDAMNRLATVLDARPCLHGGKTVKE